MYITVMAHRNPLSNILETNHLIGPNYLDWLRNLKIVLNSESITYALQSPLPNAPTEAATQQEKDAYQKRMDDNLMTRCYMMVSLSLELKKQYESMGSAPEIFIHIQELYGKEFLFKCDEWVEVPASNSVLKPKGKGIRKGKSTQRKRKGKGICFYCGKDGHWKRNCQKYLNTLKNQPSEGMDHALILKTNMSVSSASTWVLDSGASSHICNSMQDLVGSRRLSKGEVTLRVGNGANVAALAIGTCCLTLPSRSSLELSGCLYIPEVIRNIISISVLSKQGFRFVF